MSDEFKLLEQEFGAPFNPENPPLMLSVDVVEVEWEFNCGHCDRLPKNLNPIGGVQKMQLIPYGCPNLRLTEIPFIKI